MRRPVTVTTIALVLILTGCSAPAPQPTAPLTSAPQDERTDVDWDQYPRDAQRLIDEAEATEDCDTLQATFDVADNAGFLDQMTYIDEALKLADCY